MHLASPNQVDRLALSLTGLRLRFNPFQHLDAASDPYLGNYLIGHTTFESTWNDTTTLIFAPAGGGKTALRIYTARTCWIGTSGPHPFPIHYTLPRYFRPEQQLTLDTHWLGLLQSGADALLVGLAYRPERFLLLDRATQRLVKTSLERWLPGVLSHYLDALRETGTPLILSSLIDMAYSLPHPPESAKLLELCAALGSIPAYPTVPNVEPQAEFAEFTRLLIDGLGFRSIFVLLDGVDAFPETIADPEFAADCIAPLFAQGDKLVQQQVFLKGFLPIDTEAQVVQRLQMESAHISKTRLDWTPERLAEMIRRRVYAASEGEFGSLDAISSPALQDIEMMLVNHIVPLPREALVLVGRLLIEYNQRMGGLTGQLESDDVEAAISWYQEHAVWSP